MRADEWANANELGLNPTQLSILALLEGRKDGLGVKDIEAHLGVSQPSATDSINALEKKGHVEKRTGPTDARSVFIFTTMALPHSERVHQAISPARRWRRLHKQSSSNYW
ncbi:helix-turn-helix domain-containing protein [Shinella sp.]|uniref:MarR family winged helix-turn-helix transcriptional regulator n=1 Tax=Shinella sp. TaxID=1870904 RepID=UPI0028A85365|nr:helix-turn-helix domain-containing protein [Shinella sp.]